TDDPPRGKPGRLPDADPPEPRRGDDRRLPGGRRQPRQPRLYRRPQSLCRAAQTGVAESVGGGRPVAALTIPHSRRKPGSRFGQSENWVGPVLGLFGWSAALEIREYVVRQRRIEILRDAQLSFQTAELAFARPAGQRTQPC